MKLLFDQNLSPHLVHSLSDLYPESAHVQSLGLDQALDTALWDYARDNGFAIVSKDVDFSDRSTLNGHPPKVIWIRLGNSTTARIERALRTNCTLIKAFGADKKVGLLTIF